MQIQSKLALFTASALSLLTACGGGGGASAVTSSAEGKYIYPGSNVMVVVDVQKFFTSKIWTDQVKPVIDADANIKKEMEKSIADAGFDPMKDLKTVFISGNTDNDEAMGFVLVGASSFDSAKFIAKVKEKEKDAQIEAIGANAVFGTSGKAEQMTELKKGAGVDGSPDVKALWDSVDKSGVVTAVVSLKGKKIADMAGGADPSLAKATAVMFSLNVTDGIATKVSVRFSSADEANAAKTAVDAQMKNPQFGMVAAFATIAVTTSGSDLVVDVKMTKEQITTAINLVKGMVGSFGAPPKDMPMPMPEPMPVGAPGAAPAVP